MRILMVATNPDYVAKAGGTTASRNKLISLFARNNDVILLNASGKTSNVDSVPDVNGIRSVYNFKQWFISGKCVPMFTDLNISFLRKIRSVVRKEKIDLICVTEPYGITSASCVCHNTPIVYDAHDVISEHAKMTFHRIEMYFKAFRFPVIRQISRAIFLWYILWVEWRACRRANHVIAITERDKHEFMRKYHINENKITAILVWSSVGDFNKISLERGKSAASRKINIIFHGIYNHPANYEAFKLIEDYIAPEVGKRNGDIEFLLAGTDVPQYAKGNLKSLGYISELLKLLETCSIAIVPILHSTGVNMKVLDYMSAGLAIVTTKQAAQGIGLENGKHAVILDKVDDNFVEAVLDLASDSQKREMLGRNAQELLKQQYDREIIQTRLDNMLTKIKLGNNRG